MITKINIHKIMNQPNIGVFLYHNKPTNIKLKQIMLSN